MLLNKKVADIFYEMATLLELLGENPFRIRAYERAAMRIESMNEDLEEYIRRDSLTELSGIGKDLAEKIKEIHKTSTLKEYEELKKKVPSGLVDMLAIPGLGPKKIRLIYERLNIDSIDELKKAAEEGKLRGLPKFGPKTEENILKGIEFLEKNAGRVLLGIALPIALELKGFISHVNGVKRVDVAGSIRRFKETVHDIDLLAVSDDSKLCMDKFVGMDGVEKVLAKGDKKSSVIIQGLQVDFRVFEEKSYGAALMYFTGSKEHNIALRTLALDKGYKLNEYGLFKGDKFVCGKTEEEIYAKLGLEWIYPEIREDQGEIELALESRLPKLIDKEDIRGDLHMHTKYSDGANSVSEMANKAKELGYNYIAITDHSFTLTVANGMTRDKFFSFKKEVDELNRKGKDFRILIGMEIDIFKDGSLDCHKDILDLLDIVVIAVHSGFKMTKKEMTKRIIKAICHPRANILAHPTGRLLGVRDSYEVDMDEILKAAKDNNVALELNSSPYRLDISSEVARKAKELGVKIAINTDSHSTTQLENMAFGLGTARRGWLEKDDVINAMELDDLLLFLQKKG